MRFEDDVVLGEFCVGIARGLLRLSLTFKMKSSSRSSSGCEGILGEGGGLEAGEAE